MEYKVAIPEGPMAILRTLEQRGYEAYVVGGCVRYALLGREPHDWDIVTDATPTEIIACFDRVIETGLKHGTVTVATGTGQYEVTTFRGDGTYSDGSRPDQVLFTKDIVEDLSHRDFTMNAIAANCKGKIIDPYDGICDIAERLIRCVGDAKARFSEDALRILRALRFSSQFGFDIDPLTAQAIHCCKGYLDYISCERTNKELTGILCGEFAHRILIPYSDVIAEIVPDIAECVDFKQNNPWHCYDVYRHTVEAIRNIEPDPVLRLTMFYHDIGKPKCYTQDENGVGHFHDHAVISADIARSSLTRLRFNNEVINTVTELVEYHDTRLLPSSRFVLRMLNRIGETQFRRLLKVREADVLSQSELNLQHELDIAANVRVILRRVLEKKEAFTLKDLSVNGDDLIETGMSQGAEVGQALNWLLEEVIDGNVMNERDILLQHLSENWSSTLS